MPAEIKYCTSCGSDHVEVAGNKFLCRVCNIVYEVTDTGTKVVETDPLGKHEQRLSKAERDIADLKKEQQGGNKTVEAPDPFGGGPVDRPVETETDDETEEDETEEDGFVSW